MQLLLPDYIHVLPRKAGEEGIQEGSPSSLQHLAVVEITGFDSILPKIPKSPANQTKKPYTTFR